MTRAILSAAAAACFPGLVDAVDDTGLPAGASCVTVVAAGEDGDIVVRPGAQGAVDRCTSGRLVLTVPGDGIPFAAALIAAVAFGDSVPATCDPASRALLRIAAKVAARDVTVLIAGPTGTGKEGLARFVHANSSCRSGSFVAINCAAIPETMLEATLFGYERGAFTGAASSSPGLFRAAAGGTLLLDEVSELPLALQAKLLRALQENEVLPVGATSPVRIDTRIVATANRDLPAEVAAGRFRADLFYRLAVFPLTTVELAARPADIVPIAAALWLRQGIAGWPTAAALAKLVAHPWPGNVRELGNVLARAAILAEGSIVAADDIHFDILPVLPRSLGTGVRAHEFAMIRSTLAACDGRRRTAAERLGISERTLRYKLAAMNDKISPMSLH